MVRSLPAVALILLALAASAVTVVPDVSACRPISHPCVNRCLEGDVEFSTCSESQQQWVKDGVTYLAGVEPQDAMAHVAPMGGQAYARGASGAVYVRAEWSGQGTPHTARFTLDTSDLDLEWTGATAGTFNFTANSAPQELTFAFQVKGDTTSDRATIPFTQESPSGTYSGRFTVAIDQPVPGTVFSIEPPWSLGFMALLGFLLGFVLLRYVFPGTRKAEPRGLLA